MKKALALLVSLFLIGCGTAPGADPPMKSRTSPTPPPEDIPSNPASFPSYPALPEGARLISSIDFDSEAPFADAVPADVKEKSHFFPGNWQVVDGTYQQGERGNGQALSIRRWNGTLPSRYRIDVTSWPYRFTGKTPERINESVGVMALLPYFQDETHYLILSASAKDLQLWTADGFVPGVVWPESNKLLASAISPTLGLDQAITMSAAVDLDGKTIQVFLNGQDKGKAPLEAKFINNPKSFAIASNGSLVRFSRIRIYSLPGGVTVAPTPVPVTPVPVATPVPVVSPPTRVPARTVTPVPEEEPQL